MKKPYLTKLYSQKNKLYAFVLILLLIACTSKNPYNTVYTGMVLEDGVDYVYHKDFIKQLGDNHLFIMQKAFYNHKHHLVKIEIAKPEGGLLYTLKDLKQDTIFWHSTGIKKKLEWKVKQNQVYWNNTWYAIKKQQKDTLFAITSKRQMVLFLQR